jgi:WD40 repeat protein
VDAVAVGLMADGTEVIVSGDREGTVRVWRLADGAPVGKRLRGHDGPVDAVAVGALPDGTRSSSAAATPDRAGMAAG